MEILAPSLRQGGSVRIARQLANWKSWALRPAISWGVLLARLRRDELRTGIRSGQTPPASQHEPDRSQGMLDTKLIVSIEEAHTASSRRFRTPPVMACPRLSKSQSPVVLRYWFVAQKTIAPASGARAISA